MVPVYLSVALGLLIVNLGVAALSGIVVLVISLAINGRMMKRLHQVACLLMQECRAPFY